MLSHRTIKRLSTAYIVAAMIIMILEIPSVFINIIGPGMVTAGSPASGDLSLHLGFLVFGPAAYAPLLLGMLLAWIIADDTTEKKEKGDWTLVTIYAMLTTVFIAMIAIRPPAVFGLGVFGWPYLAEAALLLSSCIFFVRHYIKKRRG